MSQLSSLAVGVCNGTKCTMHSITFPQNIDPETLHEIESRIERAAPGEITWLPEGIQPLSINVTIPTRPGFYQFQEDEVLETNYSDDGRPVSVIVPIIKESTSDELTVNFIDPLNDTKTRERVRVKEFVVELGFAITFHKIQGRTIPLLLLNLNNSGQKPHLTFEAAYVALTRVTHGDNVRIMGALNVDLQLDHLLRLNADPDVQGWLRGFGPDGLWSKERAMSEASVLKIAVAAKKDAQRKARQRLYKAHFDESKAANAKDGKDETNRQQQEASSSTAPSGRKKPAAKVPHGKTLRGR